MPLSLRTKGEAAPLPAGVTARVQLSPERIQQAGIETAEIAYRPMAKEISTVGDGGLRREPAVAGGQPHSGYVEKVVRGQDVRAGRPGRSLGRNLQSRSVQHVAGIAAGGQGGRGEGPGRKRPAAAETLRRRRPRDRRDPGHRHRPPRLVIRSPRSGRVIRKNLEAGARVEDGMTLLEIADLSEVWIEADVYEKDLALVREGQAVEATVEALPHRVFTGKVALVYPQLDAATRTNRVRLAVANAGDELRPGMYATVRIHVPLGEIEPFKSLARKTRRSALRPRPTGGRSRKSLTVPERAVIDTGAKQIVYIERSRACSTASRCNSAREAAIIYAVVRGLRRASAWPRPGRSSSTPRRG